MIAIGGIIGAGLFVGSSTTINAVGPAAVLSYMIAGTIILLVMRMLSEMAMAVPGVQSFPEFAREGLGPLAGFLSGWLYWYFWVVVVAIEAIAGAKIIQEWLPRFAVWEIGVALMALLTAVNLLSARSYGEFEFWFSAIKVAAIVAFIALAGAWAFGLTSPHGPTFGNLVSHDGFVPNGRAAVLAGSASTIFALCGAEIATIAAAESREPTKVIARMGLTVTLRILIFYVLAIILIVAVVPWTEIAPGHSPFAAALAKMDYPFVDMIMKAVILVAVLSCLNSGLYVTSRALFGLARHGDAPGWLVTLSKRRVPARAILVASLFSYGALGASRLYENVFSALVNASGAVMLFLYLMVAAAQLKLRAKYEVLAPGRLQIRMWFHPFATLFAIMAMLAVLLFMALNPELRPQFLASVWVTAGFAAIWMGRK
ncbi:MAG: permease, partial [Pseudomonadota bacterium]